MKEKLLNAMIQMGMSEEEIRQFEIKVALLAEQVKKELEEEEQKEEQIEIVSLTDLEENF